MPVDNPVIPISYTENTVRKSSLEEKQIYSDKKQLNTYFCTTHHHKNMFYIIGTLHFAHTVDMP